MSSESIIVCDRCEDSVLASESEGWVVATSVNLSSPNQCWDACPNCWSGFLNGTPQPRCKAGVKGYDCGG